MHKWVLLIFGFLSLTLVEAKNLGDSLLIQEGMASFYGKRFHLKKTSNGEVFHMDSLTAAHKTLPFGTVLKVTRVDTGKSVRVKVNDRLPKYSKRIIDLSRGAAKKLDMIHDGVAKVRLEVTDLEVIEALVDYYGEEKPSSIRLRPIAKAINLYKPLPDWNGLSEVRLKRGTF